MLAGSDPADDDVADYFAAAPSAIPGAEYRQAGDAVFVLVPLGRVAFGATPATPAVRVATVLPVEWAEPGEEWGGPWEDP